MPITINQEEVTKFSKMALNWWEHRSTKMLHLMNPVRLQFVQDHCQNLPNIDKTLQIIDIGCGGGILTEPLSRQRQNGNKVWDVYGLDASAQNIEAAKERALQQNLDINYINSSVEDFAPNNTEKFDVITMFEVIEHVDNPQHFVDSCLQMLRPGGLIFFSTINKTAKSFAQAIVVGEYLTRMLDIGTHQWSKFVEPAQFNRFLMPTAEMIELKGMGFNILHQSWELRSNLSVNYIGVAKKLVRKTK